MLQGYDNYIKSAIKDLSKTQADFGQLKKKLSKQYGIQIPTNADLRDRYNELLQKKKIKRSEKFEKILLSRAIRTQSGVAVVAVLTKSFPCPGKCIYCPSEKDMPKSYLSNEPAVMRAIDAKFNPYRQVQNRLRSLELNGHQTDKIELIVMGGTFSFLPKRYQKKFITECFKACNDYPRKVHKVSKVHKVIKSLDEKLLNEQKKNEKAKHRIIGLTLETRPDFIDAKEIANFRNLGCTRVELGVQSTFDDVLKLNHRGHPVQSTVEATKMLKDAGFKINYHMMPGLPGSTPKRDFDMFKALFEDPHFQPDMLKIYPTVVLKNSPLYDLWKKKKYKPLTDKIFEKLVLKIKNEIIPPYVRISRLVRDVPTTSIIAGPIVSNLRQIIATKSNCQCIRCREVRGNYEIKESVILNRIDYPASDGHEIFLQYVSPDKKKLFALLRLRITSAGKAIIREVHTYGKMTKIDKKDSASPQHIGLGKKLLIEAEKIAKKEFGLKKIAVISGVGVRDYYRKAGYKLKDTYMIKKL
ncbi:MAG TPA: tRNA uridine(34) 5-carboxymethylaminomethyl modification radical SAM/GNAT enzyme Elp3 [Candidatus Moranbacteria bacterium]|nr:tRNA uridine(34) 5-carboxymethylaminomethyl modification radical SAM/GNAT enzyme Elp3 [Candidatus Moranbacteria bacterium]HRY28128.1 tRNA uridine(34) 5-carboxymethylaminomethyl modification radical SAM/GNAT enzyme Elp3 [Candidatus Moranbacteria bacterium]HSA08442.1 tRNA uridine(34) 5-carboxymethylaminomethyl modification radical SAM/GNAT enzyme Elp3 [Candidatus Moranbacteria bacterium]